MYAAAFHDCPAIPRGSPVLPWNHSWNAHPLTLFIRATRESASAASGPRPRDASAIAQSICKEFSAFEASCGLVEQEYPCRPGVRERFGGLSRRRVTAA